MDQLTADMLTQGGIIGILSVIVLALIRGWVVPKGQVDEIRADRDAWRQAHGTEVEARKIEVEARRNVTAQMDRLLAEATADATWHREKSV